MNKIKIIVSAIPPSYNEFLGNSHSFRTYKDQKDEWHWLIKAAIHQKPDKPFRRAAVNITYFFPDKRRRDPDNYSGKFILDAIVKEKILLDDSFDVISLSLNADIDRYNPRTEIEIVEIKKS